MTNSSVQPAFSPILTGIPFSLTTTRLLIAPAIVILAAMNAPRFIFVLLIAVSFLTDWLDGVIARRLGIATVFLRRYDIVADVSFYLGVLAAICLLEFNTVWLYKEQFILLLLLEISCQVFHFIRFRAFTATHSYLCKFWAIFLAAAAISILGFGLARPFLQLMFWAGYLAYADVLLIILFAKNVPIDVISAYHVWQTAKGK